MRIYKINRGKNHDYNNSYYQVANMYCMYGNKPSKEARVDVFDTIELDKPEINERWTGAIWVKENGKNKTISLAPMTKAVSKDGDEIKLYIEEKYATDFYIITNDTMNNDCWNVVFKKG